MHAPECVGTLAPERVRHAAAEQHRTRGRAQPAHGNVEHATRVRRAIRPRHLKIESQRDERRRGGRSRCVLVEALNRLRGRSAKAVVGAGVEPQAREARWGRVEPPSINAARQQRRAVRKAKRPRGGREDRFDECSSITEGGRAAGVGGIGMARRGHGAAALWAADLMAGAHARVEALVLPHAVGDLEEEGVASHAVLVEGLRGGEGDEHALREVGRPVALDGAPHGTEGASLEHKQWIIGEVRVRRGRQPKLGGNRLPRRPIATDGQTRRMLLIRRRAQRRRPRVHRAKRPRAEVGVWPRQPLSETREGHALRCAAGHAARVGIPHGRRMRDDGGRVHRLPHEAVRVGKQHVRRAEGLEGMPCCVRTLQRAPNARVAEDVADVGKGYWCDALHPLG
mmetsp:Transcript_31343/g.100280  ORF Transcript_31343/g.100280 Transcript_31343/m.100280 type:complete len:397 (-) Transcript_31343:494-1684(-)